MYHYRKANGAGSDLYQSQYPRRCMPSGLPLTVVEVSHSSEALNSSRWFFSHIALCEEHARSMKTFFDEPMSLYKSRTVRRNLLIVGPGDHQRGGLHLSDNRAVPAPGRN